MIYDRKEKIIFSCTCVIESIDKMFSEKTQSNYVKVRTTQNNCFFCFREDVFIPLLDLLTNHAGAVELHGLVTQRHGGTFIHIESIHYRNSAGNWQKIPQSETKEQTVIGPEVDRLYKEGE